MLGTVKNALVVWMGIIFLAELVTPLQVNFSWDWHPLPRADDTPLHTHMNAGLASGYARRRHYMV